MRLAGTGGRALAQHASRHMTGTVLTVTASQQRSQRQNRKAARERLAALLRAALAVGSGRGGSVAGNRPGTTGEGARRTGEPASRAAGRGREGAIGRSASACPWRRSVSAPAADPPSASTSAGEELRGPRRVCAVLTGSGCRTGPVHVTRAARSRPPSKRSVSDAAPGSRGGSPPPAGPGRPGRYQAREARAVTIPGAA